MIALSFEEMVALVQWYQKRYHDMVQNTAFQERLLQSKNQTINELESKLRSIKT
jgi:hypothetical protein